MWFRNPKNDFFYDNFHDFWLFVSHESCENDRSPNQTESYLNAPRLGEEFSIKTASMSFIYRVQITWFLHSNWKLMSKILAIIRIEYKNFRFNFWCTLNHFISHWYISLSLYVLYGEGRTGWVAFSTPFSSTSSRSMIWLHFYCYKFMNLFIIM